MEVVIYTNEGTASRFEVSEGVEEERVLASLHPDKAFRHHHLLVQGKQGVSLFVTSKIACVELRDLGRTVWPFRDFLVEIFAVSDEAYGRGTPGDSAEGCLFAELFLSCGMRIKVKMLALGEGEDRPCPSFIMDQLLTQPSLHVHGEEGRILLINAGSVVRCDFCPCSGAQLNGWHAEAIAATGVVHLPEAAPTTVG